MGMKLIAYYNFSAEIDGGGMHPRVVDFVDFCMKNIQTSADLKEFYDRIVSNCETFPKRQDLTASFNGLRSLNAYKGATALIEHHEEYSQEPAQEFAAATIADVIRDNETVPASELLKRYGMKLCGAAWFRIGAELSDEAYDKMRFRFSRQSRGSANNPGYFHD